MSQNLAANRNSNETRIHFAVSNVCELNPRGRDVSKLIFFAQKFCAKVFQLRRFKWKLKNETIRPCRQCELFSPLFFIIIRGASE